MVHLLVNAKKLTDQRWKVLDMVYMSTDMVYLLVNAEKLTGQQI